MMTKFVSTAVCSFFLFGFQAVATATEDSLTTSVYSSVSNGYVRAKMPDGTFKRETYAISNVGKYSPRMIKDQSIDGVKFPAIALERRDFGFGDAWRITRGTILSLRRLFFHCRD